MLFKIEDHHVTLWLFRSCYKDSVSYGCEVWGYKKNDICNLVHIDFIRHILALKNATSLFIGN